MSGDRVPKFTFQLLSGRKFPTLEEKENAEYFLKWSIKGRLQAQTYSFDQPFQAYQKDDFVLDFMRDPNVLSSLKVVSDNGNLSPIGDSATSVTAEPVPCTVLSMSFFDRLIDRGIVKDSGYISKCFDEFHGDFTISDELRKLLLVDDSDNYCLFDDSEREEFLFRLFRHLCLGGRICQFEDKLDPYLDITKKLYKDLVSVQKNPDTKELIVTSSVFSITAMNDGNMYYPADSYHDNTFSYLIVDPMKRYVTVLYHKFGASNFD